MFIWSSGWGPRRRRPHRGYGTARRGYGGGYGTGHGYRRDDSCLRDLLFLNTGCCLANAIGCGTDSFLLAPTTVAGGARTGTGERGTRLADRMIAAVRVYQREISPKRPACCSFEPTCSAYAVEALERHGARRGAWLTRPPAGALPAGSGRRGRSRAARPSSLARMVFPWDDSRRAFADAAQWFVRTAALVGDRWDRPGLGEWDIRALVGHTSRSLVTVEVYLARPAASVEVASAGDYFRATRAIAAGPDVAARGRDAGDDAGRRSRGGRGGDRRAGGAARRLVRRHGTGDDGRGRHAPRGLPPDADVRAGGPHRGPRHGARRADGRPRDGRGAGTRRWSPTSRSPTAAPGPLLLAATGRPLPSGFSVL